MNQTLPKITVDGKETPFREFIRDMADTGFIFNEDCEDIIKKAVAGELDWITVDDYFGPITSELLVEAVQEDKDVFDQLTLAIKSAFYTLKERREKEEVDREYVLDRDSNEFFREFDGLIHELANGKIIKEFDNQPLGKYRVVVGIPDKTNEQLQKRVADLEEFIASIDETENCEEYIREFIERS